MGLGQSQRTGAVCPRAASSLTDHRSWLARRVGEWFICRTSQLSRVMTPVITPAMVLTVDELVRPGDLEAGDVIALPQEAGRFLVSAVRLGQGGFTLVVAPADGSQPGAERHVTLTTAMRVRRLGRVRVI